jgi:hypothetical protein
MPDVRFHASDTMVVTCDNSVPVNLGEVKFTSFTLNAADGILPAWLPVIAAYAGRVSSTSQAGSRPGGPGGPVIRDPSGTVRSKRMRARRPS